MVWNNMLMNGVNQYLDEVDNHKIRARERSLDYLQGRIDQYESSTRRCLDFVLGVPAEIQAMKSVLEGN